MTERTFYIRHNSYTVSTDGEEDIAFSTNLGTGFNDKVLTVIGTKDNRVLCGGYFTQLNGITRNHIVKLNDNGTPNTAFNTNLGTGFSLTSGTAYISKLLEQSDGKIIVAGDFDKFNDEVVTYPAIRLNADGTRDYTYIAQYTEGLATVSYRPQLIMPTDHVLAFVDAGSGLWNGIEKINPDGTRNNEFVAPFVAPDGEGNTNGDIFFSLDGNILAPSQLADHTLPFDPDVFVRKINASTGEILWSSYGDPYYEYNSIKCICDQYDGKILVGGFNFLKRHNTDGTYDTSFNPIFNGTIYGINAQSDGRILVLGDFTLYNGVTRNGIIRLNPDGTEDTSFTTIVGTGFTGAVLNFKYADVGDILICGDFTQFNGNTRNRLLRLSGYIQKQYPYYVFTYPNPGELLNDTNNFFYAKKLYIFTPKTIDSSGTTTTYALSDDPISLENFQISSSSDLGNIEDGVLTIKVDAQPDSGRAILAKLEDWDDAGYETGYVSLTRQILNKLNAYLDETTENNAQLKTRWVVLFLYNEGENDNFIVLVYQGNDPLSEEQVVVD